MFSAKVQVSTVGNEPCSADKAFGFIDTADAVRFQDVFFEDDTVDVICARRKSQFANLLAHAEDRNFDMANVIQVKA